MRILIVDDHAMVRRGMREIIDDDVADAVVGEAADTAGALEAVRQSDWDIVLLDLNLPGRGGMEGLRLLRELRPELPILVISMHPEYPFGARAMKDGAAGYVTKESAPAELVTAVQRVAAGGKYIGPRLAEALAVALQTDTAGDAPTNLSQREFQVLCLLASGRTVKQLAVELSLSIKTVSTYRTRLLEKLQLRTTSELIRYAVLHGLVQ